MGNGAGGVEDDDGTLFDWEPGEGAYPDADAAITDIRILAARNARRPLTVPEVNELVKAWAALDGMLCGGAALPEPWERYHRRPDAVRGQNVIAPNPDLL